MDRAAAVGVTRAVTVADDLASARWVGAGRALGRPGRAPPSRCTRRARPRSPTTTTPRSSGWPRDPRVVAVGETGLDYYWDYSPPAAQQESFRWHIDLAKRLGKPLMIHDRDAHDDVLRILREEGAAGDGGLPLLLRRRRDGAASASTRATCCRSPGRSRSATRARCARPPRWCPTTSCSWRPTRRSSPRTRTAAGRTSRTACPGPCAASRTLRGVPDERLAASAGRNAERVFRLAELPPVAPPGTSGAARLHVRRSGAAARRSRRVAARLRRSHPVTVP